MRANAGDNSNQMMAINHLNLHEFSPVPHREFHIGKKGF
jgi:hypothetical protein